MEPNQKSASKRDKAFSIIGIVLCVLLIPLLIANVTMIIKSYTNPDAAPDFFGITPMYVMTESMAGTIEAGDMVIVNKVDPAKLTAGSAKAEGVQEPMDGDIISFYDPASSNNSVTTHRIYRVDYDAEGNLQFWTWGDANNAPDSKPVPAKNVIGRYVFHIPKAGHVAMFMQTTPGLLVCVFVPLVLFVGYDLLRRRLYDKSKQENMDDLMAELEALRAAKNASAAPAEEPQPAPPTEEAPTEEAPPEDKTEE